MLVAVSERVLRRRSQSSTKPHAFWQFSTSQSNTRYGGMETFINLHTSEYSYVRHIMHPDM